METQVLISLETMKWKCDNCGETMSYEETTKHDCGAQLNSFEGILPT